MPGCVAIITARGGSRRLPGKNLAPLAGRPLLAHTVAAARGCPEIDAVFVTTDDAAIAAAALAAGAQVIERPADLAGDDARSEDAVLHALGEIARRGLRFDLIVLLQPTSPLRTAAHIGDCLAALRASGARSAVSVSAFPHSPFKTFSLVEGWLVPNFSRDQLSAPAQSLPMVYRPNGAIYVVGRHDFEQNRSFFIDPVFGFPMSREASVDIDDQFDLALAEWLIGRTSAPP